MAHGVEVGVEVPPPSRLVFESSGTAEYRLPPAPGPTGWRLHILTDGATTTSVVVYALGNRHPVSLASAGTARLVDAPVPPGCERLDIGCSGAGHLLVWLTPGPLSSLG